jgi:hypothetical protein
VYHNHQACTRTQFPLVLAYTITVHKSQGVSLEIAVLNITDREFVPGLTYVAVSRVQSLGEFMFEGDFDFSCFKPAKSKTNQMRYEDTIARRAQEIPTDIRLFRIKVEGNDDGKEDGNEDFPHVLPSGVLSESFFDLPQRPSSPNRSYGSQYFSDTFGGQDVGMSGMADPPSSNNDVVLGGETIVFALHLHHLVYRHRSLYILITGL